LFADVGFDLIIILFKMIAFDCRSKFVVSAYRFCNNWQMARISGNAANLKVSGSESFELGTFVQLSSVHREIFFKFLSDIEANDDYEFFHPHGFDAKAADVVVGLSECGPDEYWLIVSEDVLAYGMLRGWAEGYAVPSLGVAVAPHHRCRGLARRLMIHLHARAFVRGARKVRLKVERNNQTAKHLYERLGYEFQDFSSTELVGFLKLPSQGDYDT